MEVVYDDSQQFVTRILGEVYSDRGRGGERFSSKLTNSRRNEKIDLPCISA